MSGKQITELQNTDQSIRELSAQRCIYSIAKKWFSARVFFVVFVPVIVSVLSIIFPDNEEVFNWTFSFYALLAIVAGVFIDSYIKSLKKKAASVQEKFDCRVLNIPWNDVLLKHKPSHEMIYKYSVEYGDETDCFVDWYATEINRLDTNLATLVCQRTNCTYDFSYRNNYTLALSVLVLSVFLMLTGIFYYTGSTVSDFVINVLFPIAPLCLLFVTEIVQNRESISNLKELKEMIEQQLDRVNIGDTVDDTFIRRIQDRIYYNRILSPLLPDFVFNYLRPRLENQMYFGVAEVIASIEARAN